MSGQKAGFYFSCDADGSAHDHTIFAEQRNEDTVTLGARYKNSDPNHLYEIEMDADDLHAFGQMCIALAQQMQSVAKLKQMLKDKEREAIGGCAPFTLFTLHASEE